MSKKRPRPAPAAAAPTPCPLPTRCPLHLQFSVCAFVAVGLSSSPCVRRLCDAWRSRGWSRPGRVGALPSSVFILFSLFSFLFFCGGDSTFFSVYFLHNFNGFFVDVCMYVWMYVCMYGCIYAYVYRYV